MAHNPHEEAEHASHHALDPFDKRVAMSMVVIAAILAMVKVLGHRTHNDTLAYQIESGVKHTQESGQWNFFQAKKLREVLARQDAKLLLQRTPSKDGPAPTIGDLPDRDKRLKALTKELTDESVPKPDEAAGGILAGAEKRYKELLGKRYTADQAERVVDAEIAAERYSLEGKAISSGAKAKHTEFEATLEKSAHKHHQAMFFDLGELGVELALVLSSIAILTKVPNYWYGGIVVCAAGLASIALGFLAH